MSTVMGWEPRFGVSEDYFDHIKTMPFEDIRVPKTESEFILLYPEYMREEIKIWFPDISRYQWIRRYEYQNPEYRKYAWHEQYLYEDKKDRNAWLRFMRRGNNE